MLTKANPTGKAVRQKQQSRKMYQHASATGTLEKVLYEVRTKGSFVFILSDNTPVANMKQ